MTQISLSSLVRYWVDITGSLKELAEDLKMPKEKLEGIMNGEQADDLVSHRIRRHIAAKQKEALK